MNVGTDINYEEQRLNVAQKLMSILDEDGQPMYNEDWIQNHILGTTNEIKNPE